MFQNRQYGKRRLTSEKLESRALMAADLIHNFMKPHDVNDDGKVSALDALVVINHLNGRPSNAGSDDSGFFPDVNDDSRLSPLDVLHVVNVVNNPATLPVDANEYWLQGNSGAHARVEMQSEGTEVELSVKLVSAEANKSYPVTLNDIALGELTTDSKGRGRIKLSQGDNNRNRQALPSELSTLSPEMELVIGEVVVGRLGNASSTLASSSSSSSSSTADSASLGATSSNSSANAPIELWASFSGTEMKAEYEVDDRRGSLVQKFEVEIEDADRNASYVVSVDGKAVVTLWTDSRGAAKMKWSTSPKDSKESPLPSDFPLLAEGTQITIASHSAIFQRVVA